MLGTWDYDIGDYPWDSERPKVGTLDRQWAMRNWSPWKLRPLLGCSVDVASSVNIHRESSPCTVEERNLEQERRKTSIAHTTSMFQLFGVYYAIRMSSTRIQRHWVSNTISVLAVLGTVYHHSWALELANIMALRVRIKPNLWAHTRVSLRADIGFYIVTNLWALLKSI